MANILHELTIEAEPPRIFETITTPEGLDQWWTHSSCGEPQLGSTYTLGFGPEYNWEAKVTRCVENEEFELELVEASDDWIGTRVGFRVAPLGDHAQVSFWHTGWREETHHLAASSYCWAMYLRILRQHVESGTVVPYEHRLDA